MSEPLVHWWGLKRRQPRFWLPRRVRWSEVLYFGGIVGLGLLVAAYVAEHFLREQLQAFRPYNPLDYLRAAMWIFIAPSLVALALRIVGAFDEKDPARMLQNGVTRLLEWIVFLLRERGSFARLDLALACALGGRCAWRWFLYRRLPVDDYHELPLFIGAAVVLALGFRLIRNRFHPRARRLEIPEWFRDLCREGSFGGSFELLSHSPPAPDPAYPVAWPDDASDFLYTLADDLAEPIRQVGVRISEEVRRLMQRELARTGGALFRANGFRGSARMLNPFEGPLQTIGLVEYKRLVAQLVTRRQQARWNHRRFASVLLAFVQREIRYESDAETTGYGEYGRFPLQTLAEGQGDCECKALLCCALLSYCGYDSALIFVPGHVVCGLLGARPWWAPLRNFSARRLAVDYLWGETTAEDGGQWVEPNSEKLRMVDEVIRIPAINLNSEF